MGSNLLEAVWLRGSSFGFGLGSDFTIPTTVLLENINRGVVCRTDSKGPNIHVLVG